MDEGRVVFEIQTYSGERWSTGELRETENMATTVARGLLAKPGINGVRVVRSWTRNDGRTSETTVYTEMREREMEDDSIVVSPITEAHFCTDINDYYGFSSRSTINRLFRKYIEKAFITPTEILYHYRTQQKIQAFGTLFMAGVDRVSSLQGQVAGENSKTRRDVIYDVVAKISKRAHTVGTSVNRPKLSGNGLDKLLDAAVGIAPAGKEDFFAQVSLCEELVSQRSWLGKFERLAKITGSAPRDDVLIIVDGHVADLIGIAAAFEDILGFQRNLAHSLCSIADLCEGRFDAAKSDAREQLVLFGPLIAAGRMPQTTLALLDRLLRLVSSRQPLDRFDPSREPAAFQTVLTRMLRPDGSMFGGEGMTKALKERSVPLFGPGADLRPKKAAPPPAPDPQAKAAHRAEMSAGIVKKKTFPPGTAIYREGVAADHAYMILAGNVELSVARKGKRIMVAQLEEDAFFGELALFSQPHRGESAVTITGCELQIIDKDDMDKRGAALDPFCRHWMTYLIKRITDLSGRVPEAKKGDAA
jgi:Cyclic nucleotide-binding domain